MSKLHQRRRLALAVAALSGFSAVPAQELTVEEVIVTATKRAESMQDVPISVTAFNEDSIKNLGLTESAAIATQTPNLQWRSDFGGTSPNIFLRGVGNNSFHANAVGAVGIYSDGVYLNSNLTHAFPLFDLERVEVLRGPQGTLYGRNTTGGLVNFIARKPGIEEGVNAYLQATLGAYKQRDLEFAGGMPLGAAGAARVAVQSQKRDGIFDAQVPGLSDKGENETLALRTLLNFQLTDDLGITVNLHGGKNDSDLRPFKSQGQLCPGGATPEGFGTGCTDFLGFADNRNFHDSFESLSTRQDTETYGAAITLEWDLPPFTVTSITAYEDAQRTMLEDTDRSPAEFLNGSFDAEAEQFSQELRFTSNGSGVLRWIGGLFYFEEDMQQYEGFAVNDLGPGVVTGVSPFEEGLAFISAQDTQSYSLFGELNYALSERLTLTLGTRWTYDERDVHDYRAVLFNANSVRGRFVSQSTAEALGDDVNSVPLKEDWSKWSGRVGLDYALTDEVMFYVTVSRCFKGGEFNSGAAFFVEEYSLTDPEFLTATEIGIKSTWLDNSLRFNAAAFHYDFDDQQVFTLASGGGMNIPVQTLSNAGKSTIQGLEAELHYLPAQGWFLQLGLGWLDSEFDEYEIVDPSNGEVTDFSGNEQPSAPKLNFNGMARHEWRLAGGASLSAQADFVYTDQQFFTADNNPSLSEGDYWLLNGRITFTTADEKYAIVLWGRNLTDEEYIIAAFDSAAFGLNSIGVGDPRTYGLTVTVNWE